MTDIYPKNSNNETKKKENLLMRLIKKIFGKKRKKPQGSIYPLR